MATRTYSILADSNPSEFLGEAGTRADALEITNEMLLKRNVFIQTYVNGKPGVSYTPAQLHNALVTSK